MNKILRRIILIACVCGMIFFSYNIIIYFIEENSSKSVNDDLVKSAVTIKEVKKEKEKSNTNESNTNINDDSVPTTETVVQVDFEKLKQKNKDIIGWIYLKDTPINYPIVQSRDNDYYLRRLIDGSYNRAGTIFADYRCSKTFEDPNTIIYGHNMQNNTMFGTLMNYTEQSYYDEHKEIILLTENKSYKIELFAGFTTVSDSEIYNFPKTEKTNKELIEKAKRNSTFKSDVDVTENDKIITLSTCSYDFEDARFVLLGILKVDF